jgi:recombination protein RecT
MSNENQVVQTGGKNTSVTVKEQIKSFFSRDDVKKKFEEILGAKGNQFVASVLQLSLTDNALQNATPATIYGSAMIAATLDLPVNKNLGYAWIIGYKNRDKVVEAQFQMGYKGYIQLALRSQQYDKINAIPVYANQFKKWNALTETLDGDFDLDGEGQIVGYVAYFRLKNGFEKVVYWSRAKVEAHARKYSKTYNFSNSTWKSDFDGMALKTVLKNLLEKWGILSVEMIQAITSDQGVITDKGEGITETRYEDVEEISILSKEEERLLSFIQSAKVIADLDKLQANITTNLYSEFQQKYEELQTPSTTVEEVIQPKKEEPAKEVTVQGTPLTLAERFSEFSKLVNDADTLEKLDLIKDRVTTKSMKTLFDNKYDSLVDSEMEKTANELGDQQQ